jgi:hypothetical protein
VGQQRVVDLQLGVAQGNLCFGLAAPPGELPFEVFAGVFEVGIGAAVESPEQPSSGQMTNVQTPDLHERDADVR